MIKLVTSVQTDLDE